VNRTLGGVRASPRQFLAGRATRLALVLQISCPTQ